MVKPKHYKDYGNQGKINQKISERENIKEIAHILKNAYNSSDPFEYLRNELIDGETTGKATNPNHISCNGYNDIEENEERICRCMFYYDDSSAKCNKCIYERKWHNKGEIEIVDYATPMKTITKGVGEIDLLLKHHGELFAAEVKPPKSDETVSRMVAEILTYTAIESSFRPALVVFEDSYQYKTLKEMIKENNSDFNFIRDKVNFYLVKIIDKNNNIADFEIIQF